ncbi:MULTISPECIES: hypothetical protein [unclassified Methanopyrus]|uniref:hypothetical protein n=1 Tax=Methanopyrus sp. SNP6 TaxID=1937005 RepID=UPI001439A61F|nr:hypothetical protein [Methanopyrus sp. SNP6]
MNFRPNLFGDPVDRDYEITLVLVDGGLCLGSTKFVLRRVEHAETRESPYGESAYRCVKSEKLDARESVGRNLVTTSTTPTHVAHGGKPKFTSCDSSERSQEVHRAALKVLSRGNPAPGQ